MSVRFVIKSVKVPEGLTCKLSGEDGSEVHEAVEQDDPTRGPHYLFPNIKRIVTKAQVYEFDISCSLDKLPHAAMLKEEAGSDNPLFLKESFQIMVVPGPARKLKCVQDNFVLPPIVNSSASKAQRSFWPERFIIQLVDEFQNKVSNFPCNSTVKVEIIAKDPKDSSKTLNLPPDSLPAFEQVTLNQRVTAGQAVFPTLSVKPKIGKSGHYFLKFSLEITERDSQQKKNTAIPDITPLELPFIFTDNTELRNEEKRIQEEKAKINEKLNDLRSKLKKSTADHEMTTKNINTLKENWKSLKETLIKGINTENFFTNFEESVPQLLTDQVFKDEKLKIAKLLEKLSDNEEILSEIPFLSQISEKIKLICDFVKEKFNSNRRKPKIPPRSSNPAFEFVLGTLKSKDEFWDKAILGSLADLGHIQDDKIDFAISNFLRGHLATILVDTTKSAEMIKKEIKTFISTLEKPQKTSQNYPVSILPLDMLSLPPKGFEPETGFVKFDPFSYKNVDPPGFVGHACNLFEFKPEHSKTVRLAFYALLNQTLVFETYEHAKNYRLQTIAEQKEQLQNNKNPKIRSIPLLLSLDGEKIESTGVIQAGQVQKEVNANFGQLPMENSVNYRKLLELKERIVSGIELQKKLKLAESENLKIETEIEENQKKIPEKIIKLEEDLENLDKKTKSLFEMNNNIMMNNNQNSEKNSNPNSNSNNSSSPSLFPTSNKKVTNNKKIVPEIIKEDEEEDDIEFNLEEDEEVEDLNKQTPKSKNQNIPTPKTNKLSSSSNRKRKEMEIGDDDDEDSIIENASSSKKRRKS